MYRLKDKPGQVLVSEKAVGETIGAGLMQAVRDIAQLSSVRDCEVFQSTDPDWEPVMRRVAAIVTDQGGRTAHAAIVSREFESQNSGCYSVGQSGPSKPGRQISFLRAFSSPR